MNELERAELLLDPGSNDMKVGQQRIRVWTDQNGIKRYDVEYVRANWSLEYSTYNLEELIEFLQNRKRTA